MKNHRGSYGTGIAILCLMGLITLFCIPVNTAQSTRSEQVAPSLTKRVALLFTFADKHQVSIGEREGRMITIENQDGTFGFTPHLLDDRTGRVAVKIFRITKDANGETPEELEELLVNMASSTYSTALPSLSIKLKKVQTTVEPKRVLSEEGGECCIRDCAGEKICADCFECNGTVCGGPNCDGFNLR